LLEQVTERFLGVFSWEPKNGHPSLLFQDHCQTLTSVVLFFFFHFLLPLICATSVLHELHRDKRFAPFWRPVDPEEAPEYFQV
jgi:hypothetical protein